jgi:hypothetical protein
VREYLDTKHVDQVLGSGFAQMSWRVRMSLGETFQSFSLAKRVIIATGGSSGIGRAAALKK